ncbi:hypothetical protein [Leptospira fluminis]|nr:hypothetical protein [Leptospira fluminis]
MIRFFSTWIPILALLSYGCGKDIASKMQELKDRGNYLELSLLCTEHREREYKSFCDAAWTETSAKIDGILSQKAELPFLRISVDEGTRKQVEEILSKNPEFREKYLPLWKKFVQE